MFSQNIDMCTKNYENQKLQKDMVKNELKKYSKILRT